MKQGPPNRTEGVWSRGVTADWPGRVAPDEKRGSTPARGSPGVDREWVPPEVPPTRCVLDRLDSSLLATWTLFFPKRRVLTKCVVIPFL